MNVLVKLPLPTKDKFFAVQYELIKQKFVMEKCEDSNLADYVIALTKRCTKLLLDIIKIFSMFPHYNIGISIHCSNMPVYPMLYSSSFELPDHILLITGGLKTASGYYQFSFDRIEQFIFKYCYVLGITPPLIKKLPDLTLSTYGSDCFCKPCGYHTFVVERMRKHQLKKFNCSQCDFTTCDRRRKFEHLKTKKHLAMVPAKNYKCDKCDKLFYYKRNLDEHLMSKKHSNTFKYSCVICEYQTNIKSNFVKHNLVHSNNKDYSCIYCNFKSSRHDNVLRHQKSCKLNK